MNQSAIKKRLPHDQFRAFRVWTAEDFRPGRNAQNANRDTKSTPACQLCRSRKIRCYATQVAQNAATTGCADRRCQPCKDGDLDCRWDVVDGRRRKRRRLHHEDINTDTDMQYPLDSHTTVKQPFDQSYRSAHPHNTKLNTEGFHSSRPDEALSSMSHHGPDPNASLQVVGQTQNRDFQLDTDEFQLPEDLFESFSTDRPFSVQHELCGDSEFVFGLDFTGFQPDAAPKNSSSERWLRHNSSDNVSYRTGTIRLTYYRRLGPNAVKPGLQRLSAYVKSNQTDKGKDIVPAPFHDGEHDFSGSQSSKSDHAVTSPHETQSFSIAVVIDTFFQHFAGHFPFVHPEIIDGHVRSNEASSVLMNAISALAVRFFPVEPYVAKGTNDNNMRWRTGAKYLVKAKEQVISLLGTPAPDVVAGLVVLSWAEYGDNSEAGLWMFSGMAIRMALDLGLHRTPDEKEDPTSIWYDHARPGKDGTYILTNEQSVLHQQKARLMIFWSVVILDVCVSLISGRSPALRHNEIEIAIPTATDMKLAQLDFSEQVSMTSLIFPQAVTMMLHFSQILEILNREKFVGIEKNEGINLLRIENEMHVSYTSMRPELVFNAENYRSAVQENQAGLFLGIHLFFYTFCIMLPDHTPLRKGNESAKLHQGVNDQAVLYACQKVLQIVTVSDLIDRRGLLATPFANHCLFVAASALLRYRKAPGGLIGLSIGTDIDLLCAKLREMAQYFGAVNSVVRVLEQRIGDIYKDEHNDQTRSEEELDPKSDEQIVRIGDPGYLNRYTIR